MARRSGLALIVSVLAGLIVIAPSSPVGATFPGTNGRIAFDDYAGSEHIFTVNPDGSDVTDLTPGFEAASPAWSPDGSKIAFEVFLAPPMNGIWVMDANGSNKKQLTDDGGAGPSYSPDGTRIVYTLTSGLVVMRADGTHGKQIVSTFVPDQPEFSSNGKMIAYSQGGRIWVVLGNGRGPRALTRAHDDSNPSWSPDGTRIAFTRSGTGPHSEDVWIMDADGTNLVNVTANLTDGTLFREPAWSPDGTKIALQRYPDCYGGGLITINVDGTGETGVFCLYDARRFAWQSLP
jgi:TolB protein